MAQEDRSEIVSVVEETYALLGRALAANLPDLPGARADVLKELGTTEIDPLVTDNEMLNLIRAAYAELGATVSQLNQQLLGTSGEQYDVPLQQAQLTDRGRRMKVRGFRRALNNVLTAVRADRPRWVRRALKWANIILGSLSAVPGVGALADPIKELKESVEAQADEDQGPPTTT
jgi:hypothetical protein